MIINKCIVTFRKQEVKLIEIYLPIVSPVFDFRSSAYSPIYTVHHQHNNITSKHDEPADKQEVNNANEYNAS